MPQHAWSFLSQHTLTTRSISLQYLALGQHLESTLVSLDSSQHLESLPLGLGMVKYEGHCQGLIAPVYLQFTF